MIRTLPTIGVYGWTLDRFLYALRDAEVALLLDVRQRRGVRGREYSWANAQRLQHALAEAGIGYWHHKELAPTTELRHVAVREGERLGGGKRSARRVRAGAPGAVRARDPRPRRPRPAAWSAPPGGPPLTRRGAALRGVRLPGSCTQGPPSEEPPRTEDRRARRRGPRPHAPGRGTAGTPRRPAGGT